MRKKTLTIQDYYKHAVVRVVLFVLLLILVQPFLAGTEYGEIYSNVVIILAGFEICVLGIDYIFLWSKK